MASSGLPPKVNRGPEMLRAIWIMDGIAALVVGLRIFTSGYVQRRLSWSDGFMILALIFALTNNAIISVSESWGLGQHIMYLSDEQVTNAIMYQTIAEPIGIMSPTFGRIAFALYMFKLVGPKPVRRYILHACIWFGLIVNILTFVLIFAQCPRVDQIWEHTPAGVCWSKTVQSKFGYFQGAVNTLVDLILTILPATLIWGLQMTTKLKIGLVALLGLSFLAAIASIVKTVELKSIGAGGDITYNLIPFVIWFTIENDIVMISASIPAIRPLFMRRKPGNTTYGYNSHKMSDFASGNSNPKSQGYLRSNRSQFDSYSDAHRENTATATSHLDPYGGPGIRKDTSFITTRDVLPGSSGGSSDGRDSEDPNPVALPAATV